MKIKKALSNSIHNTKNFLCKIQLDHPVLRLSIHYLSINDFFDQEMLRRNEKSSSPSRRPLSPPVPHPRNPLFKSKPENNYPLNNNNGKDNSNSGVGVASRISQSTSGLNCLMLNNNGLDSNGSSGKALSGWRSDPRLSESNGSNFAIRHVS